MPIHITYDENGQSEYRTLDGKLIDTPATRYHAAATDEMARERLKELMALPSPFRSPNTES